MISAAVIGLGKAGICHAKCYVDRCGVDLIAAVDPQPSSEAYSVVGEQFIYRSVEAMLERYANIDVASICLPPSMHAEAALDLLERGIACICEKPLAVNLRESRAMAMATHGSVPLIPVRNYLYSPWWSDLTSGWQTGSAGHLVVEIERPAAALGSQSWWPAWRMEKAYSGGGVLWDMGVHALYLSTSLFNCAPSSATVHEWVESAGCEIECRVVFEFGSGCVLDFRGSWAALRRRSMWTISADEFDRSVRFGEWDSTGAENVDVPGTGLWIEKVIGEYTRCVDDVSFWHDSLRYAVSCVGALEAAQASARSDGRTVDVIGAADALW